MEHIRAGKFNLLSSEEQLKLLHYYQNSYENNLPDQISDSEFDTLVKLYENKSGKKYTSVGAAPTGVKQTLPYYLGSLDKVKGKTAEVDIQKWLRNYAGSKVIQDKIDGISGLYIVRHIDKKVIRKLYTRGNGYVGTDISHLLNYIDIPVPTFDVAVRGEIVIPLKDFKFYVSQTPDTEIKLKNARNAASGVVNSKEINENLANMMKFFTYNILDWNYDKINAEMQLQYLHKMGFDIPWHLVIDTRDINVSLLETKLNERRKGAEYDIDGLVIIDNTRFYEIEEGHNPREAIAFKVDVYMLTTVTDVVWHASKDGVLKPVVLYEPVSMSGVVMSRASGKNAKFIVNNNIGPGAEILITRAGDVIPDIVDVVTPASEPKLPLERYSWNESEIEFILDDDNQEVMKEKIEYFMKQLDIKNVGPGRIALLYDNGFDSLEKLLSASIEDISKIPGLGLKSATQIYSNIHEVISNAPLSSLMTASGVFGPGFGNRKMEAIVDVYPDILSMADLPFEKLTSVVASITGFDKTAAVFAEGLPFFLQWLDEHPMIKIAEEEKNMLADTQVLDGYVPMTGLKIVFTGIRSAELEDKIKQRGGTVSTSVSKNTSILVAKNLEDLKGKGEKAAELNVPIMSVNDFIAKYNLA